MSAKVDINKCVGCGICVDVCPVQAIRIENGKVIISDSCIECGACVNVCPRGAISIPGIINVSSGMEVRGIGVGLGGRRGGRGFGAGPSGTCVCPKCGTRVPHTPGTPCNSMVCPKCGTRMVRG